MSTQNRWPTSISIVCIGAAAVIAWYLAQQQANTTTTEDGDTSPAPWWAQVANGGMPSAAPIYWGQNAPFVDQSQINVNVNPDYLASIGMSYMPLFGFVAVSTPDIVGY